MKMIGVFGGVFDPPHIAHLIIAEQAREEIGLDKIVFIPNNLPPLKARPIASPNERLMLVKEAIDGNPYFEVSDIEIKRGGISYTVDTLKELKKIYPSTQLFLIIGMDEAVEFIKWKEPNTILKLAKFIVFYRPGARKNNLPEMMKKNAKFKEISLSISSTSIRRLIKEGKSIKYLVPTRVEEYIIKKELYNE